LAEEGEKINSLSLICTSKMRGGLRNMCGKVVTNVWKQGREGAKQKSEEGTQDKGGRGGV